jgi:uncharacterized protein GlcG (DUF336 family)
MEKLIRGVALVAFSAFVIGTGYGLVQQMVKMSTLQSLNNNDISVEQALLVAQGAMDACKKKDNSVISVAVVDRNGMVRFLLRGDGASNEMADNARRKAYTARTFRQNVSTWMERTALDAKDDKGKPIDLNGQQYLENTIAEPGGVPIIRYADGIGGVGVTGAKGGPMADEACAQAGADAIADQLL